MKETEKFLSLEREELINILQEIKHKYQYSSPEKIVSHFLIRIYPDPDSMDLEDRKLYSRIKYNLKCFWRKADKSTKTVRSTPPPP